MFESKTEISGEGFECKDISGRLYLWTPTDVKPTRLIITAHGYRRTCSTFQIKNDLTLNFYSEDKNSVEDPGLKKFYEGTAKPAETLKKGGSCYNYILSKYTNSARNTSHNKQNETYQGINKLMKEDYKASGNTLLATSQGAYADKVIGPGLHELNRKIAMKSIFLKKSAVLTVRHRRLRADVNLEWVLNELKKKGHNFSVIDCLFCRNTIWTAVVGSLPIGGDYSDSVPVS